MRWIALAAVVAAAALGVSSGVAASSARHLAASGPHGPVYEVGSTGGVTWARGVGGLWLTADDGKTWRTVPLAPGITDGSVGEVARVEFADREHGWVLLDRLGSRDSERYTKLGRTSDGGRSWRWSRLDLCSPTCNGNASLSFLDRQHGFLSAGTEQRGWLFRTNDGGVTWHRLHPVDRGPIAFLDGRQGILVEPYVTTVSTTGSLFVTGDGGTTWRSKPLGFGGRIDPNVPAVFGSNLVASAPYAAWVSRDAGAHWTPRHWPIRTNGWSSLGFSAVSPTTWFAGEQKRLWLTTDAGRGWQLVAVHDPEPHDRNANILGLDVTSRRDGWALFGTTIFHTRDGGVHWTREEPVERSAR